MKISKDFVLIISCLISCLISFSNLNGQALNCDNERDNKWGSIIIPNEICIPKGYRITFVYKNVDVNGDNLNDFVYRWSKKLKVDGDTSFISISLQTSNGKYVQFKKMNNLYPLFFENYELPSANKKFNNIKAKYYYVNPFHGLEFKNQQIVITFGAEVDIDYVYYFTFDKSKNNWYLTKKERIDSSGTKNIVTPITEIENNFSIENFKFEDFL